MSESTDLESLNRQMREILIRSEEKHLAIAARAGISKGYLSELVSGRKGNPSTEILVAIARATGYRVMLLPEWVDEREVR